MTKKVVVPVVAVLIAALALVAMPRIAAADFAPTPTPNGLTITTYTGSLDDFQADGAAQNLISAFATIDGDFVGYVFGAPAFVNSDFVAEFSEGMTSQGLIVRAGDAPDPTPTPTPDPEEEEEEEDDDEEEDELDEIAAS